MQQHEFEALTGLFPTTALYRVIEQIYMDLPYDKEEFCKRYVADTDHIAMRCQTLCEGVMQDARRELLNEVAELRSENEKLLETIQEQKELLAQKNVRIEQLLGWKVYEPEGNFPQSNYVELLESPSTKEWPKEDVKAYLWRTYGFDPTKVEIMEDIPEFLISKEGKVRFSGKRISRKPLYNATDWQYVRFDCGAMAYEVYDDCLHFYTY